MDVLRYYHPGEKIHPCCWMPNCKIDVEPQAYILGKSAWFGYLYHTRCHMHYKNGSAEALLLYPIVFQFILKLPEPTQKEILDAMWLSKDEIVNYDPLTKDEIEAYLEDPGVGF